ncbi:hypothetical protein IF1G_10300 [Cordyceps javanica]|uniref:Uncharacterized protein n=1 Tax=Cordyceps javanica TaxID=43265 RepID=A0A545UNM1_9HYPO|nr:hypothetical protein IF1G_10300 [Cordyceps javanica]
MATNVVRRGSVGGQPNACDVVGEERGCAGSCACPGVWSSRYSVYWAFFFLACVLNALAMASTSKKTLRPAALWAGSCFPVLSSSGGCYFDFVNREDASLWMPDPRRWDDGWRPGVPECFGVERLSRCRVVWCVCVGAKFVPWSRGQVSQPFTASK